MVVTNLFIYFVMVGYNNYQLASEIKGMLDNINTQEWLYETVDTSDDTSSEETSDDDTPNNDTSDDDASKSGVSNNPASEDTDSTTETSTTTNNEENDSEISLPLTKDLIIPKSLSTFSFYAIFSAQDEMVKSKMEEAIIGDELMTHAKQISLTENPKLVTVGPKSQTYYLLTKRPITIGGVNLGYFEVGKDVTVAYETLNNLVKILLYSMIGGIVVSALLGYLIAGRTIKPIRQAYDSKQRFLESVSHELRTPLSVILLSANTLEDEIPDSEDFQKEIVSDIKDETKKMGGLIEKLLLLARSDSHKMIKSTERFNMSELVLREAKSFQSLANKKSITQHMEVEPNVMYEGDKKLLTSVISILTDNAIKYNKEGGTLTITLTSELKAKGHTIQLRVKDTGTGIPENELEHIFERFYRLEGSRSKKTGGYGLGLSIAREIVSLHNGTLQVKSEVGVGSEFMVNL